MPAGVTLRMRWLAQSAMYTLLAPSTATPRGKRSCALVAAPPSPENPWLPFPAIRSDNARRRHLANALVGPVRNVHIARAIYRDAQREEELRAGSRAAIPGESLAAVPRDS